MHDCKKHGHEYIVVEKAVWERAGNYLYNLVVDFVIVCTKCGDSTTQRKYIQGNLEQFYKVNKKNEI